MFLVAEVPRSQNTEQLCQSVTFIPGAIANKKALAKEMGFIFQRLGDLFSNISPTGVGLYLSHKSVVWMTACLFPLNLKGSFELPTQISRRHLTG